MLGLGHHGAVAPRHLPAAGDAAGVLEVGRGEDADDAGHGRGGLGVDPIDPRVRRVRAQEVHVGLPAHVDVVGVAARAGQEPRVLAPADGRADARAVVDLVSRHVAPPPGPRPLVSRKPRGSPSVPGPSAPPALAPRACPRPERRPRPGPEPGPRPCCRAAPQPSHGARSGFPAGPCRWRSGRSPPRPPRHPPAAAERLHALQRRVEVGDGEVGQASALRVPVMQAHGRAARLEPALGLPLPWP